MTDEEEAAMNKALALHLATMPAHDTLECFRIGYRCAKDDDHTLGVLAELQTDK